MDVKLSYADRDDEVVQTDNPCMVEVFVSGVGLRTLRIGDGALTGVTVVEDADAANGEAPGKVEAFVEDVKEAAAAVLPKKTPAKKKPAAKK